MKFSTITVFVFASAWGFSSCRSEVEEEDDTGVGYFEGEPEPVDPTCTSVRTTSYGASSGGWCEFDRTLEVLPEFVRQGMTFAIAEPWNGGSYQGEPGEACGECWEVSSIEGTYVLMEHDLCPIEGNPLCSGGHFHFDLASEAGEVLGGGLFEAAARRVPCPVTGNVYAQINDANEWGYLRLAFVNHRYPIRSARVRALPDGEWRSFERSGGAWHIIDGPVPDDGDGLGFELTTPEGEVITSTTSLDINPTKGTVHDLGVQFAIEETSAEGECKFTPPEDVFDENWGGIEGVGWMPNPWGDSASIDVVNDGCKDNSNACLEVTFGQWEGAHLYYWEPFPWDIFTTISMSFRGLTSGGELSVAPSMDGERCTETPVTVMPTEWTDIEISLADVCSAGQSINGVTFSNNSERFSFVLDEVSFR